MPFENSKSHPDQASVCLFLCLLCSALCNKVVTFLFLSKVFGRHHSPPKLGGVARSAGAVCSTSRSHLIDFRAALLMDRCAARSSIRKLRVVTNRPGAPACGWRATPPWKGGDFIRLLRLGCGVAALCFLCAVPDLLLIADTLTGELRGTVLDVETKLPMPDVNITLTNTARGWKKDMLTIVDGEFVFIQLEPGVYSVTAQKDGFYASQRTDILVRLNQIKVVIPPIELRRIVSTPTQQITVRGEQTKIAVIDLTTPGPNPAILAYLNEPGFTSMISLLNGTLSWNFDADLINLLPLRGGRSFDQLALLPPGVFRVPSACAAGPPVGI